MSICRRLRGKKRVMSQTRRRCARLVLSWPPAVPSAARGWGKGSSWYPRAMESPDFGQPQAQWNVWMRVSQIFHFLSSAMKLLYLTLQAKYLPAAARSFLGSFCHSTSQVKKFVWFTKEDTSVQTRLNSAKPHGL